MSCDTSQTIRSNAPLSLDKSRQFLRYILFHVKVFRPLVVRSVNVEASTLAEVITFIVGNIISSWRRIGQDNGDAFFLSLGETIASCFLAEILISTGQPTQIVQSRDFAQQFVIVREENRKDHVAFGERRGMFDSVKDAPLARHNDGRNNLHFWHGHQVLSGLFERDLSNVKAFTVVILLLIRIL